MLGAGAGSMVYVIRADWPFQEIEAQIIEALERREFVVRCTFRLAPVSGHGGGEARGYSVIQLYESGTPLRPLGQVTLQERGRDVVLASLPASPTQDFEADLVVALSLGGLDFCVSYSDGEACVDASIGSGNPDRDRKP
jgi:hypothetical protein